MIARSGACWCALVGDLSSQCADQTRLDMSFTVWNVVDQVRAITLAP